MQNHIRATRRSQWIGLCLLLAMVLVAGCKKNTAGPANSVTGKVTFKGSPVNGMVVFHYSDGPEVNAPINSDGTYTIVNPTPGQVKVLIKGGSRPVGDLKGGKGPEMPSDVGGTAGTTGVQPPPRYATPQGSDLTYEVKAGKHTDVNFDLKP